MLRFVFVLVLWFASSPARAQDIPPFPEYPDFRPDVSELGNTPVYSLALLDLFEVAPTVESLPARFEGFYRIGTDYSRFWLKGEGEGLILEGAGEIEIQTLYSRLISPFFEAQAGVRLDTEFGEDDVRVRPQLVLGLEGLAPYWFEIAPALFLSAEGHLAARFEGSYDVLITQRLVLQPEAEVNLAIQNAETWGIGRGLNDIETGLRFRYELRREIAPYLGVSWLKRYGGAADFARAEGVPVTEVHLVFGIRLWR